MLLQPRIQTVGSVNEFMSGTYKVRKIERKVNKKLVKLGVRVAVTIVAGSFLIDLTLPGALAQAAGEAIPVMTPATDALGSAVNKAIQPLIDVLKELAKPIAGVMVTWGCLRYMIGQKEAGLEAIQQAAIGYVLVMLSPVILNLITGVGAVIS